MRETTLQSNGSWTIISQVHHPNSTSKSFLSISVLRRPSHPVEAMGGNKKLETWVIENRSMLGMRQRHARQRREQTNLLRWRSQGDSTSQASCGGISLSPRKTVGLGNLANPRRVHFKAGAMLINSRIEPYSTINKDRASASLIKRSRRDPPKETHSRGTPPTAHFRCLLLTICKQLLATLRFDF